MTTRDWWFSHYYNSRPMGDMPRHVKAVHEDGVQRPLRLLGLRNVPVS